MKKDQLSYKTFVYPLDVIGFPSFFLSIFAIAIIAMAIDDVLDIYMISWITLMTIVPLALIMWFERKIYEIVQIDATGIKTRKASFLWDDNCYKGVCVTTMGRLEHPKCLYFSKQPISDEVHIMLKRNTANTIAFPLTKKSKIALKTLAPEIYNQFRYEIEK